MDSFSWALTLLQHEGGTGRRHYLIVLGTKSRYQTRQHLDTKEVAVSLCYHLSLTHYHSTSDCTDTSIAL